MTHFLHGAPGPFETESPNSWLQRIAYRYDLSFADLQEAVGATWDADIDTSLSRQAYGSIARSCLRPVAETNLMYTIFGRGQAVQVALRDAQGRPKYRFCVGCLQGDAVPHLRIEWRIEHWSVCPTHLCRLQDCCGACGRAWTMDRPVLRDRRSKARSLAHCQSCGQDQRKFTCDTPSADLREEGDLGRAVVSALGNQHAYIVRGLTRSQIQVPQLLSLLDSSEAKVATAAEEPFVNLVIDRTKSIGIERRLALQRMGAPAIQPGRLAVAFARYEVIDRGSHRVSIEHQGVCS